MKKDKKFQNIKNIIYRSVSPEIVLRSIKGKNDLDILSRYFNQILELTKMKSHYLNNLIIDDINKLETIENFMMPSEDIWKELGWATIILNKYSSKLKEYINLKEEIENNYLLGNYDHVNENLDLLEDLCGYSLWSIKVRMNLIQTKNGLDAQKKYSSMLRNKYQSTSFGVYVYLSSLGTEENTSHSYFKNKIESFFQDSLDTDWCKYYMFLFRSDYSPDNNDDMLYILNRLTSSSFIDLYEGYIRVLSFFAMRDVSKSKNKAFFIKGLRKLYNNTKDEMLINFLRRFDINIKLSETEKNIDYITVIDLEYLNKYDELKFKSKVLIETYPNKLESYNLYISSLIKTNSDISFEKNTLVTKILENMKSVEEEKRFSSAVNNLLNLASSHPSFSFSRYLYIYIYNKLTDYRIELLNYEEILDLTPSGNKQFIYENNLKKSYFNNILDVYPQSIDIKLHELSIFSSESDFFAFVNKTITNKELLDYLYIAYYYYLGEYKKGLNLSKKLINTDSVMIRSLAREKHLYFLSLTNIYKAVDALVELFIEENVSHLKLPIGHLCDLVEKEIDNTCTWPKDIEVPILFHLYYKYRDLDKKSRLEYLYENFLVQKGFERPTELIKDCLNKNIAIDNKLLYYLNEICVPDILKKSVFMQEAELKERERINICHDLVTIDTLNKNFYLSEIKEREQELFLKKEMKRIGKNKIYVNVEGIKKVLNESLKDDFNRFVELSLKGNISINELNIYEYLNILYSESAFKNKDSFNIPTNEVYDLMKNMVETIRDAFVNHEHYGLNVYLSTKIRHGTIKNHLRKPVEDEHLITLKNKQSDKYNINEYLEKNFFLESESEKNELQKIFQEFSKEYDELIEFISKKLLQVRINNKLILSDNKDALFRYDLSEKEMSYILNNLISNDIVLDDFINNIISYMWNKTDYILKNIRIKLEEDTKKDFIKIFDKLTTSINNLNSENKKLKELKNSILRGKQETSKSILNLTAWFNRLEAHARNDYNIKNSIDLVIKTIPKVIKRIDIKCPSEIMLKGWTLESFVDIFYILVDNCIKHSNISNTPKIGINLKNENNYIILNIENEVNSTELKNKIKEMDEEEVENCKIDFLDKLNKELDFIKNLYGDKKVQEQLYSEGKTGFLKIWKILKVDLNILTHEIDFKYKIDNLNVKFYVELKIYGKDVLNGSSTH